MSSATTRITETSDETILASAPDPFDPANASVPPMDSAAVADLFRKHGPTVYRRALHILRRREDAEDAMHEVFIRVMRGHERFEGRSAASTWLYQITTNYCRNQLRDRNRRRELLDVNLVDPEADAGSTQRADAVDLLFVRRLLADGDERQALATAYVHLDGMSQDEAAAALGVSQRTVSNLVERFVSWAHAQAGEPRAAA